MIKAGSKKHYLKMICNPPHQSSKSKETAQSLSLLMPTLTTPLFLSIYSSLCLSNMKHSSSNQTSHTGLNTFFSNGCTLS
mmetsp:Transcript_126/g.144  ORF Transcript_126/g.144 Transcript_126/m.144 type:complete len:80 (+) Transcript_126:146-385(+)